MSNISYTQEKYFACANGYQGFRSNFNKIFTHNKQDGLFIIKGGPGTGKSTLMRNMSERFANTSSLKYILCSSDPRSLDGMIIKKGRHSVVIADGTAPHILEPKYPGAFENIVNLGDSFDTRGLRAEKDHIVFLSELKSEAYRRAYANLKTAGDIHRYIDEVFLNSDVYTKAESAISKIINVEAPTEATAEISTYFLSAFCKDGLIKIDIPLNGKKRIPICGDGISEYLLTSLIKKCLSESDIKTRLYYSPLSSDFIDAIETNEAIYFVDSIQNSNANVFTVSDAEYCSYLREYKDFMSQASKQLNDASRYHFELESIYSKKVSYKNNDEIMERMVLKINELLEN